mmetsp:Transcript_31629/g.72417  ORF Transcript_31629/g.72417 Transcript_31629/m.72417 type:complete len:177 (+) Transcript_31629:595-1125(+)
MERHVSVMNRHRTMARPLPNAEAAQCTMIYASRKEKMPKRPICFSRKYGLSVGDERRIRTRDALVSEKQIKIPAEIMSSSLLKGTKEAMKTIRRPEITVPFIRFPLASILAKNLGTRPSFASAYINRGCAIKDTNTTIGRVNTSPNLKKEATVHDMKKHDQNKSDASEEEENDSRK